MDQGRRAQHPGGPPMEMGPRADARPRPVPKESAGNCFNCFATHHKLEEAYEKLGKAHKKLEKAYSSLFNEQIKKKHVETCDVGLTCDIIDESLSMPIIVPPTN